ncbi:MAG: serine hydrolase [Hyphomicrobiales bacterium]
MSQSCLIRYENVVLASVATVITILCTLVPSAGIAASKGYTPPYSEMVVDITTGKTLYQINADAPRHPASITKVMTLYLLFEQIESGRLKLNSPLKVSANAQRQAPSKLGLLAGETISVEDAIKALITKSANDVAVVVAESLGGTEANFAQIMTKKARSLGMSRTLFANASGLPNSRQTTTARDLVRLGKAIQDRFPRYYSYFSTESFTYEGAVIGNHNKLLGRVEGVDGIKTGYTNRSGFNLLTSVKDKDRRIVAVILGGRSGASRDRRMEALIDGHLMAAAPISGRQVQITAEPSKSDQKNTKITASNSTTIQEHGEGDGSADDEEPVGSLANSMRPIPPKTLPNKSATSETGSVNVKPKFVLVQPKASSNSKTLSSTATDWVVQIGTADSKDKANALLARVKNIFGKGLSDHNSLAEEAKVGTRSVWRARYTNFSEKDAQETCRNLKKSGFSCFVTRRS